MAELRAAAKGNVQRGKRTAAADSSPTRERSSRPQEGKKQVKPAASRASAEKPKQPRRENKERRAQPAHAVGPAVGLTTGGIAAPLLSPVGGTPKWPQGGFVEQLEKEAGDWWGRLSGALESSVWPNASSALNENEIKGGEGEEANEVSADNPTALDSNGLKWTKRRPIFTGGGASVYRYSPGDVFNSEVTKYIEKVDRSDDFTKGDWLRSELGLGEDVPARAVLQALQEHPEVFVHATDGKGIDGMLLAKPGRNTSTVPYWEIQYADAVPSDPRERRAILSRITSQYMRANHQNGLTRGYYFSKDISELAKFFDAMGVGGLSNASTRKGNYSITPHDVQSMTFGEGGWLTNEPSGVPLYSVSVKTGDGREPNLTPLEDYRRIRFMLKNGEVGPLSPIVIKDVKGTRDEGLLDDILTGIYSLNPGENHPGQYHWRKNQRAAEVGDYFKWLKGLGAENSEESLLAALQPRSRGMSTVNIRGAKTEVRKILDKARSPQSLWRYIRGSDLYYKVYTNIRNGIPLLPMSLIKNDPYGMPDMASVLLQMKHLEALDEFAKANPGSTDADFERTLLRPEELVLKQTSEAVR